MIVRASEQRRQSFQKNLISGTRWKSWSCQTLDGRRCTKATNIRFKSDWRDMTCAPKLVSLTSSSFSLNIT